MTLAKAFRITGGTLRQEEHGIEARQRLEEMLYALPNWLIEPPEAVHRNFTFDKPQGVVLKPYRRPGDQHIHRDAGLYPNADQFISALLPRIPSVRTAVAAARVAVQKGGA